MRGEEPTECLPPYWVELFSNVVGYVPLSYPDIDLPIGTETEKRVSLELASTMKRLKGVYARIHPELF
jgi:acetoin utilization protein AcuC